MTAEDGSRLSYWIAVVLRDERERHEITPAEMGTSLGVSARTIKRLETGDTMGRDIDAFVAGYAYVLAVEDGRILWRGALDRWQEEGSPPRFLPVEGPAAAFGEAIRIESLRRRQDADGRSGKRRAIR